VPWTLYFPFSTVDERVAAREHISVLRRDPAVTSIRPAYTRGQPLTIIVEFLEGHDEPSDYDTSRRIDTFRSLVQPPPDGLTIRESVDTLRDLGQAPDVNTPEGREALIMRAIMTQEGRQQLAASMIQPLRRGVDYQSVGRRTFLVEQLPDGVTPITDLRTLSGLEPNPLEPIEPPDWAVPGAWVRYIGMGDHYIESGDVKQIEAIIRPADYGSNGPNYVRLQMTGNPDVEVSMFKTYWCSGVEPPDIWDRLQGEDLI
jgi:hypothetical protein